MMTHRAFTTLPEAARSWYLLYCQPLHERRAAHALEQQIGLTVFMPELTRSLQGAIRREPLFPGYVFVFVNLYSVAISRIMATPGVVRFVSFGELPLPVANEVIEHLRQQVAELNVLSAEPAPLLQPGDRVRLKHGPFQGLDAVVLATMKSNERVRVLLHFLGRASNVDVLANAVEPIVPERARRNERGTRGKGRPIKKDRAGAAD